MDLLDLRPLYRSRHITTYFKENNLQAGYTHCSCRCIKSSLPQIALGAMKEALRVSFAGKYVAAAPAAVHRMIRVLQPSYHQTTRPQCAVAVVVPIIRWPPAS